MSDLVKHQAGNNLVKMSHHVIIGWQSLMRCFMRREADQNLAVVSSGDIDADVMNMGGIILVITLVCVVEPLCLSAADSHCLYFAAFFIHSMEGIANAVNIRRSNRCHIEKSNGTRFIYGISFQFKAVLILHNRVFCILGITFRKLLSSQGITVIIILNQNRIICYKHWFSKPSFYSSSRCPEHEKQKEYCNHDSTDDADFLLFFF